MNIFNPKDPIKQQLQEAELEVKEQLKQLGIIANGLLLDTRYRQFAELLKTAEQNTIELLLDMHKSKDPERLKKYDELLTELGVYKNILYSVKDLANPKQQPKPNLVQKFKDDVLNIINRLK